MLRRLGALGLAAVALAALASDWRALHPPDFEVPRQGLVVDGLTLVNPGEPPLAGRRMTVVGGRIERIESAGAGAARSPYAGAFVVPGLIDLHVHHPPAWAPGERELFALLFLAHGVTSVRDTGSLFGAIDDHRRRITEGRIAGPRIFACGQMLDGDPPSWPGARAVHDVREAEAAVAALAASGVDCIKVYNGVSAAAYQAIRASAAAHALRLVAHVPRSVPLDQMGRVEVQHLMGLTESWWEIPPARIAWYVEASRAQGISHTPTLVAFARAMDLADYAARRDDPTAALLPRYHREILWDPACNPLAAGLSPLNRSDLQRRLPSMQQVLGELHRAGVPVLAGTDTGNPFVVPGASLHEELRLLTGAGLGSEEVWDIATRRAGEVLGVPKLGTLQEGAPADFLIFREDPTRDLAALTTLEAVVADGRLYPKAALDAALAREREFFDGRIYRTVSSAVARLAVAAMRWRLASSPETTTPRR